MNETIDATNFLVNKSCSGTLIDAHSRFILTANHCIENQYETVEREKIGDDGVIKIEKVRRLRPGRVSKLEFIGSENTRILSYKFVIKAVDKASDLALLQIVSTLDTCVDGTCIKPAAAKFACTAPVRGDQVFVVGNPKGILYSSVTKGIVSSLQRDYSTLRLESDEPDNATQPLMQISGGVIGGNSGGSVYNNNGELIGVPVLAYEVHETLGFAVPLNAIKSFLSAHGVEAFEHCKEKN
jgi:S1-C subfamily serine protease